MKQYPPYDADIIAQFFIKKSIEDERFLSPLKLIKLVYFSQGWYLGLFHESLINERIEAWKFGPVVASLYHKYKQFGNDDITHVFNEKLLQELDSNTVTFLNRIWEVYGSWTAIQLANLSHERESPWHIAWYRDEGKKRTNHPIPNERIENYFSKQVA